MYLKIAWHLKTYIDTNSSKDFEKLHKIKNQWLFGVNKTAVFLNPILDGGGKFAPPPAGFFNIAQKPLGLGS